LMLSRQLTSSGILKRKLQAATVFFQIN